MGNSASACCQRQGGSGTADRKLSLDYLFPMWVMKAAVLIELEGELEPHDVQKRLGQIVQHEPGKFKVVFVSHQWRGRRHPDKGRLQFKDLQVALKRLALKTLSVSLDMYVEVELRGATLESMVDTAELTKCLGWHCWYDYFSCPQLQAREDSTGRQDLLNAVDSIPYYVDQSDYFFVLAPSVAAADSTSYVNFRTWQTRGWCRVEQAACMLSARRKLVMVISSATDLRVISGADWTNRWPGDGTFTEESDRTKVLGVMRAVIQQAAQHFLAQQQLPLFRLLTAFRPRALRGLAASSQGEADVHTFLERYAFTSVNDCEGLSPLMCAVMEDNTGMVGKLAAAKGDLNAQVGATFSDEFGVKDGTPLMGLACMLASPSTVAALLSFKADINASCSKTGAPPLMIAAVSGSSDVLEYLLDQRADMAQEDMLGGGPVVAACYGGMEACVATLLARRADPNQHSPFGPGCLGSALTLRADMGILRLLLGHRADVNWVGSIEGEMAWSIVRKAREAFASGQALTESVSLMSIHPATPLMIAAWSGEEQHVRLLLEWRADPQMRTWDGKRTALDIASWRERHGVVPMLTHV